jgi:hypothetical protein
VILQTAELPREQRTAYRLAELRQRQWTAEHGDQYGAAELQAAIAKTLQAGTSMADPNFNAAVHAVLTSDDGELSDDKRTQIATDRAPQRPAAAAKGDPRLQPDPHAPAGAEDFEKQLMAERDRWGLN